MSALHETKVQGKHRVASTCCVHVYTMIGLPPDQMYTSSNLPQDYPRGCACHFALIVVVINTKFAYMMLKLYTAIVRMRT